MTSGSNENRNQSHRGRPRLHLGCDPDQHTRNQWGFALTGSGGIDCDWTGIDLTPNFVPPWALVLFGVSRPERRTAYR